VIKWSLEPKKMKVLKKCCTCFSSLKLPSKDDRKSAFKALIPMILLIGVWPCIGLFKAFAWGNENYNYPLTIAMIVHGVQFVIGTLWYFKQTLKRGFSCFGKGKKALKKKKHQNEAEVDKRKMPLTLLSCLMRYVHWGFFPGLFLDIFIYATVVAEPLCYRNPNFCTFLFRAPLFLVVLVYLAFINSSNRGGRIDWAVAIFLFIGILLLMWNSSKDMIIGSGELQIFIAGALALVAFGAYPLSLRKASANSGVMKVLYVQSTWGFVFMAILALSFEGGAPWTAAYQHHGDYVSANYTLIWKIIAIIAMCTVWEWAIIITAVYTETIVIGLALQFSLFLGDFGIYDSITNGYVFDAASVIGMILVCLSAVWLLKRLVALNCPESCGRFGGSWDGEAGSKQEGSQLLVDVTLPSRGEEELLDLEDGCAKPASVSKFGPTYGATSQTSHYSAGHKYQTKKDKVPSESDEDTTLDDSGSYSESGKKKKRGRDRSGSSSRDKSSSKRSSSKKSRG